MARERVSINLEDWRKLTKTARDSIKNEILKYFTIRNSDDLKRVERAALLIACKAWKQWKSRLVTEFVDQEKSPFELFPQIDEEVWAEFVRVKSSDDFKKRSKAARELAKKYKNHHRMGTAGYAGMAPKWEKEDLEAEAAGLKKPFDDIKDERARNWTRARAISNQETGFVPTLIRREDIAAYEELVSLHMLELTIISSKNLPSLICFIGEVRWSEASRHLQRRCPRSGVGPRAPWSHEGSKCHCPVENRTRLEVGGQACLQKS